MRTNLRILTALVAMSVALVALVGSPALAFRLPKRLDPKSKDYHGCGIFQYKTHPWTSEDSSGNVSSGTHWTIAYEGQRGDCEWVKHVLGKAFGELAWRQNDLKGNPQKNTGFYSNEYLEKRTKGKNTLDMFDGFCHWKRQVAPEVSPFNWTDCEFPYHHIGHTYTPGNGAPTIEAIVAPGFDLPKPTPAS
jgi:hypothetical protein